MDTTSRIPASASPKAILPEPTLSRLPWYLAYVSQLRAKGVEYVSSTAISKAIGVDASQIAKDLSHISLRGKTRIGYEVASLESTLVNFLGFTRVHRAVIVGVGSLGSALIADSGLARFGLNIEAGFDINPKVVGTRICNVPVLHISQLDEWRRRLDAEIGVITVPADKAHIGACRGKSHLEFRSLPPACTTGHSGTRHFNLCAFGCDVQPAQPAKPP